MVTVLDENNLALCALVTVGYQTLFFIIACSCKFDKVTDLAGGSNFVVLAVMTMVLAGVSCSVIKACCHPLKFKLIILIIELLIVLPHAYMFFGLTDIILEILC